MNLLDFFEGMKTEHEDFTERVACAEHFIRLKKQAGLQKTALGPPQPAPGAQPGAAPAPQGAPPPGQPAPQAGQPAQAQQPPPPQQPQQAQPAAPPPPPEAPMLQAMQGLPQEASPMQPTPGGMNYNPIVNQLQSGLMHGPPLAKLAARLTKRAYAFDPKTVALMGLGTGLGAAGTYFSSRSQKGLGGRSSEEDRLERAIDANRARPEEGLTRKLMNRGTELSHGIAKAFREHPAKATLLGAVSGAGAGLGMSKMLNLALKLKGAAR